MKQRAGHLDYSQFIAVSTTLYPIPLQLFPSGNSTGITRLDRAVSGNTEAPGHRLAGSRQLNTCTLHDWVTHQNDRSWKTGSTNLEQPEEWESGLKLFTKQQHCVISDISKC